MEENKSLVVNPIDQFSLNDMQLFTTFDTSTPEGEALALKCTSVADVKLTDYLETPFVISDFYAEKVEIKQDNGDISAEVRTVIIDENGTTYSTVSRSVANALSKFLNIRKSVKGMRVKVVTVNTRGGFKAYTLVPA